MHPTKIRASLATDQDTKSPSWVRGETVQSCNGSVYNASAHPLI